MIDSLYFFQFIIPSDHRIFMTTDPRFWHTVGTEIRSMHSVENWTWIFTLPTFEYFVIDALIWVLSHQRNRHIAVIISVMNFIGVYAHEKLVKNPRTGLHLKNRMEELSFRVGAHSINFHGVIEDKTCHIVNISDGIYLTWTNNFHVHYFGRRYGFR